MQILNCDPDDILNDLWSKKSLLLTKNIDIDPYQFLVLKLVRGGEKWVCYSFYKSPYEKTSRFINEDKKKILE